MPDKDVMDAIERHMKHIWGGMAKLVLMGSANYETATMTSDFDFFIETDPEAGAESAEGSRDGGAAAPAGLVGRSVMLEEMRDLARRLQEDGLPDVAARLGRLALSVKRPGMPEVQLVPKRSDYFNFELVSLPLLRGSATRTESDALLKQFYEERPAARGAALVLKTLFRGIWVSCNLEHFIREMALAIDSPWDVDQSGSELCREVLSRLCKESDDVVSGVFRKVLKDARSIGAEAEAYWKEATESLKERARFLYMPLEEAHARGKWSEAPMWESFRRAFPASVEKTRKRMPREKPRPYQEKCLDRTISTNTIVNLPTGAGKTLVAVMAVDHFISQRPDKKVIFVVPTRALVSQQAQYLRKQSHSKKTLRVTELRGEMTSGWNEDTWDQCLSESDVIVVTAETVRSALVDRGFICLSHVSLLVFDECHYASGNDSMVGIMMDAYIPMAEEKEEDGPRVLGLTATLVRGAAGDAGLQRKVLECTLQSRVVSPDVQGTRQELQKVDWVPEEIPDSVEPLVRRKLVDLLNAALKKHDVVDDKGLEKIFQRALHVLTQLGREAFMFYVRECILGQLEAKAVQKDMYKRQPGSDSELAAMGFLPDTDWRAHKAEIQERLRKVHEALAADEVLQQATPATSEKARKLLELVSKHAQDATSNKARMILFVNRVAMTYPLADLLNRHSEPKLCATAVSGSGGMTEAVRETALQDFRKGRAQVLVCTNAVEEGLDVKTCGVVFRFDKITTVKSHIQGKGRARVEGAHVYYFENDPDVEEAAASRLTEVAQDESLGVREEQLARVQAHVAQASRVPGVHPFYPSPSKHGAQINLYNCADIFDMYVKTVIKSEFDPEDLYIESPSVVLKYPSPDGWKEISMEHVETLFQADLPDKIWQPSRSGNMGQAGKIRRLFMFTACVEMSKLGYLTDRNLPSSAAQTKTSRLCTLPAPKGPCALRDRFDPGSLRRGS